METIFVVTHEQFTESVFKRYSFAFLLEYYNIVYYDLSSVFYEHIDNDFLVEGITVITLNQDNYLSQLYSVITPKSVILCFLEFNFKTIWVFFLFKLKKSILVYINAYYTPYPHELKSRSEQIKSLFSYLTLRNLLVNYSLGSINLITGIGFYNLEFMCAVKATRAKRYVPINHPDVEIIRSVGNDEEPTCSGNYIVYVDELFPEHPDFKHLSPHLKVENFDISEYYRKMYDFLHRTSKLNNMSVVIARHPRRNGRYFDDERFEEFINRSHNLIKNCSGVILSQSASFGIAVYCKKPIVLLDSNYFPSYLRSRIKFFSEQLNVKPISLDDTADFNFSILNQFYEDYIEKHLEFADFSNGILLLRELHNLKISE